MAYIVCTSNLDLVSFLFVPALYSTLKLEIFPFTWEQIVTMLHSVMWVCLCIPGHIHCSCSTVMALLCIPVSELVFVCFFYNPYMSLFEFYLLLLKD